MRPELTLVLLDEMGREERRVRADARRLTIGRIPDNDLMVEHASLSRRHAVIESYDDLTQITDCGSQNGTMVNNQPVVGAVVLRDGDVITLGGAREILVELRAPGAYAAPAAVAASSAGGYAASGSYAAPAAYGGTGRLSQATAVPANFAVRPAPDPLWNAGVAPAAYAPPAASPGSSWFSAPLIAAASVVVILFAAIGLAVILKGSPVNTNNSRNTGFDNFNTRPMNQSSDFPPSNSSTPTSTPGTGADSGPTPPPPSDELEEIERHTLAFLRSISNDTNPVLPQQIIGEVAQRARSYQGSSQVRAWLGAVRQRAPAQLGSVARASGMKLSFLAFAGLAKTDRDGGGDPVGVAQAMSPTLTDLSRKIGNELSSDWLIVLAAYDQGSSRTATHPLQITMSNLASRNPNVSRTTVRTFWFLRQQGAISDRAYDLVIRFIALGAVAQNPQRFGVGSEAVSLGAS